MKNLLLFTILLVSLHANALYYTLKNDSFNENVATAYGSEQYLDVSPGGTYTPSDTTIIFIYHIDDAGKFTNKMRVFAKAFWSFFPDLPINADSSSRRIFFKMPTSYPTGKFKIMLQNAVGEPKSFFEASTGITEYEKLKEDNGPATYYNLNGQIVNPDSPGMYIKLDGTRAKKIMIIN
jgi:hypothetical protein